jgi:hypothetical protein
LLLLSNILVKLNLLLHLHMLLHLHRLLLIHLMLVCKKSLLLWLPYHLLLLLLRQVWIHHRWQRAGRPLAIKSRVDQESSG